MRDGSSLAKSKFGSCHTTAPLLKASAQAASSLIHVVSSSEPMHSRPPTQQPIDAAWASRKILRSDWATVINPATFVITALKLSNQTFAVLEGIDDARSIIAGLIWYGSIISDKFCTKKSPWASVRVSTPKAFSWKWLLTRLIVLSHVNFQNKQSDTFYIGYTINRLKRPSSKVFAETVF